MSIFRITADHLIRCLKTMRGFLFFGPSWFLPWCSFVISPVMHRMRSQTVFRFKDFSIRSQKEDINVFANVLDDYKPGLICQELSKVELVIDAGANVGAFSFLVLHCSKKLECDPKIIALEPETENYKFLIAQPFASKLDCRHAALGPESGLGMLKTGQNSATHTVDFRMGDDSGNEVSVLSLTELCDRPTLLKMDIEGAELAVLEKGVPSQVKSIFLEWHPGLHLGKPSPEQFLASGKWTFIEKNIYGGSCWFWRAMDAS